MALTDLTRISTSGIATGTSLSGAILHGDAHFRGTQVGVTSALFDSSDNALEFNDNVKIKLGNGGDLELYHNGSDNYIDATTGSLYFRNTLPTNTIFQTGNFLIKNQSNNQNVANFAPGANGGGKLYHENILRFNTTSSGAVVTGILTATGFSGPTNNTSGIATFYDLRVSNNLTVEGTTTTLDTNLIGVDRIEVGANSNTLAGIAVTQSGLADLVQLYDGATNVLTVTDTGDVGIRKPVPGTSLHVRSTATGGGNIAYFDDTGSGVTGRLMILTTDGVSGGGIKFQTVNKKYTYFGTSTNKLTIDNNNSRVGIGSDIPTATFDVAGGAQFKTNGAAVKIESSPGTNFTQLQLVNSGGNFYIGRENSAGNWFSSGTGYASVLRSDGAYPLIFRVNSDNRLTINSNGRVGVGTDDTQIQLQVGVSGEIGAGDINRRFVGIKMANSIGVIRSTFYSGKSGTYAPLQIHVRDGIVMHFDADTNRYIGIGNTTPTAKLDVTGTVKATNFVGALPISSDGSNRVITATGSGGLDAESTLTYNASILNVISTTQGLGLNLRNTSNEYTRIIFDAARTGASSALGILEGKWNNGNSVCQIYLQSGDDTTNKDDGRISMVVNSAAGSNKTAFRIEPDASVQLPNDSQKLQFGQHQDLSIWHGGSNGYIDNETGNLSIRTTSSNTTRMFINSSGEVSVANAAPSSGGGKFNVKPNDSVDSYFKIRNAADFDGTLTGNVIDNRNSANNASTDLLIRSNKLVLWQGANEALRILDENHIQFNGTSEEITLRTSDGSDNGYMNLSGGGACAQTRGAQLVLSGNERSSYGGLLQLLAGNSGNDQSKIQMYTGGNERLILQNGGVLSQRVGSNARLSHGILEITTSSTPSQIKITTNLPYSGAGGSHAESVTIRGFRYGGRDTVDLQICWHVYAGQFYNRIASSSGGWAPLITLGVENNKVVIHMDSLGYWPKIYVADYYSSFNDESYAKGWSWSTSAISGDSGTPVNTVPYKNDWGGLEYNSDHAVGTNPDRHLNIKNGNLIIGTSGHGIDFSATADGHGSPSELLDDYEEGSYTPTLSGSGWTYTKQYGFYRKVGTMVHVSIWIGASGGPNNSSSLGIGLPFTSYSNSSYRGGISGSFDSANFDNTYTSGRNRTHINANVTHMQASFPFIDNGGWTSGGLTNAGVYDGFQAQLSGTYMSNT